MKRTERLVRDGKVFVFYGRRQWRSLEAVVRNLAKMRRRYKEQREQKHVSA